MLKIKSKKLLLGTCFFALFNYSFSQVAGDFRSIATGAWSTTTTWQSFDGTSWVAAGAAPTAASGTITLQSPFIVTIGASFASSASIIVNSGATLQTAATFTLTNNAAGVITINGTLINSSTAATGTIINNGVINNNLTFTNKGIFTNNLTLNNATGATVTQNNSGAFTNASTGTITNIGTLLISPTRTITNNGIISNAGTITTTSATLTNGAGSFYKHNYSSAGAPQGTIPIATWNATSTCEILACGNTGTAPTNIGQSYGHFIWNNTTQPVDVNLLGALNSIAGNFTLNSTNGFNLNLVTTSAGGPTTVSGSFTLNNGNITILKVSGINKGNQLSVGSYIQTGGTMTIANCSGTFSGTSSTNGQLTVSGTSTITGGTLNVNTGTWVCASGNGNGIFQSGGLITLGTASAGSGVINGNSSAAASSAGVLGTITATLGMTINAGGTLNMNTSTTTGTGGSTTLSAGGLITLAGGTITGSSGSIAGTSGCNSTIQANAAFTMTGGTINLTPGNITGGGGTGFLNVTGALAISNGTVNLNSSTATGGTTGSNGTISVSTTCTISGSTTINVTSSTTTGGGGNGTFNVTGAFSMSAGTFNLCSTSGAGTGNGILDIGGAATLSGGTFNITSSTTTNASSGKGDMTVAGNFSHTTSAASFIRTATLATATATVTMDGATTTQTLQSTSGFTGTIVFNITQGGVAAAITTIPASTDFVVNSGTTFNVNDNPTNLTGNELKVIAISPNGLFVHGIMNVNADATLDLVANVITGTGTFNLNSEGTILTRHGGGIAASGATGCVQVSTARTYNSDASYHYYGNTAQVTGTGLPASLGALSILTINNSSVITSAGVTLTQATSTLGTLTLTSGRLITSSSNLLTLGDGAILTSVGSIATFVDGPIKKIGFTAATPFIYPTGDLYNVVPAAGYTTTVKWARIAITSPSTSSTDAFTAEYHKIDDPCNVSQAISNVNGAGLNHVSYKEYWDLNRSTATATIPTVKLYWEDNSQSSSTGSAISSPTTTDLSIAEFDGGQWNNRSATGIITAGITGNVTTNVANTFTTSTIMNFTFGAPTVVNPLPIELLSFNGNSTLTGNQINWSTATETNNNHFDLERSTNGAEFTKITVVNGAGNSTAVKNYDYLDKTPFNGMNYYRLKQVDNNGDYSYSDIVAIENTNENNVSLEIYPNPTNEEVNIVSSKNIASLSIYNALGELVYTSTSEQNKIQFNPLSKGIYVIKALSKQGKVITARFVKK